VETTTVSSKLELSALIPVVSFPLDFLVFLVFALVESPYFVEFP